MIEKNEANQRFDKYLKKRLPEAGTGFLYKMLRKKNITLNGAKATGSELLSEGDRVSLFFSEETYRRFAGEGRTEDQSWKTDPRYREPMILFEDEDLIFLNKPAGQLSQKADPKDFSANETLLRFLYDRGDLKEAELQTFHPSVVNRLDRNTSGILIAGKTLHGLQTASEFLRERRAGKYYHAIVHGVFPEERQTEGWLKKDEKSNRVEVFSEPVDGAEHIRTDFCPLEQYREYTLLKVRLHTGKSHQIRAVLAFYGFPILGDPKYGDRARDRKLSQGVSISRQMLHAYELLLPEGKAVTAPYPPDFARALEAVRQIG